MTCCTHFYYIQFVHFPWQAKTIHKISWTLVWTRHKDVRKCAFSDCPLPSPFSCFLFLWDTASFYSFQNSFYTKIINSRDWISSKLLISQALHSRVAFVTQAADLCVVHVHTRLSFARFLPLLLTVASHCLFAHLGSQWKCVCMDMRVCLCRQNNHKETDGHTLTHTHPYTHTVARWWQTWLTPWPCCSISSLPVFFSPFDVGFTLVFQYWCGQVFVFFIQQLSLTHLCLFFLI